MTEKTIPIGARVCYIGMLPGSEKVCVELWDMLTTILVPMDYLVITLSSTMGNVWQLVGEAIWKSYLNLTM